MAAPLSHAWSIPKKRGGLESNGVSQKKVIQESQGFAQVQLYLEGAEKSSGKAYFQELFGPPIEMPNSAESIGEILYLRKALGRPAKLASNPFVDQGYTR